MKTLLLFFLLWTPIPLAQGQAAAYMPEDLAGYLSKKDLLQAEHWLRSARAYWEFGDYAALRRYCRMIVEYYPETLYAREAERLLKKSGEPKRNRRREFFRDNPGLFFGF